MRDSIYTCPICGKTLTHDTSVYRCINRHSFDVAKEGYVNLLPANRKHSDLPGDDREMVNARTRFLSGGWYEPLRNEVCRLAGRYLPDNGGVMDAGCGEGYYTETLCHVASLKGETAGGIDLSRAAVKKASKRCRCAEIAVASVYHMPLPDRSTDLLTDCFAPLAVEEFYRVLKPGGIFLYVIPGRRHLWEMKEILYENPYENEEKTEEYAGFHLTEEIPLEFRFHLNAREDISSLFGMTPYSWKTPKAGKDRLLNYSILDVTAQFRILIYQRKTGSC